MVCPVQLKQRIKAYSPKLIDIRDKRQASVALILRNVDESPEMFFIERARNAHDPWSGQIAFPGGIKEPDDMDTIQTAIRETSEEVGLELIAENQIGRLDDQQGRNNYHILPLVISCHVFSLETTVQPVNNYEVADSFWISVPHLLNSENRINHQTDYSPAPYPGILLDKERVLWGLTFRFVMHFVEVGGG